jgi:hypothetical protein
MGAAMFVDEALTAPYDHSFGFGLALGEQVRSNQETRRVGLVTQMVVKYMADFLGDVTPEPWWMKDDRRYPLAQD